MDQFDDAGSNSHSANDAKQPIRAAPSPPLHTHQTETPLPAPSCSPSVELQAFTGKQFSHHFFTNHIFSIPNNLLRFTQRVAHGNVTLEESWMEGSLEFLKASRPSCSSSVSRDSIFKDALVNYTRVREVKLRFPQENSIKHINW
jgi:hypothetical protein